MIRPGGTIDSSQQWYGELGTVELVEPGSAVVDEGELAGALAGVCCTKLSGTVKSILGRGERR
jgi:hypothetical protein